MDGADLIDVGMYKQNFYMINDQTGCILCYHPSYFILTHQCLQILSFEPIISS